MSPSSPLRPLLRTVPLALGGAALVLTLSACAPTGTIGTVDPSDSPVATPSTEPEPSASPEPEPTIDPADAAAATIETGIATGDTGPIQDLLAEPTRVVIAASEADSPHTAVDAVLALDYVQPGVGTWDFALDGATLAAYRASPYYGAFFPDDAIVGVSDTAALVAFVPSDGRIATIFMSIDEALVRTS